MTTKNFIESAKAFILGALIAILAIIVILGHRAQKISSDFGVSENLIANEKEEITISVPSESKLENEEQLIIEEKEIKQFLEEKVKIPEVEIVDIVETEPIPEVVVEEASLNVPFKYDNLGKMTIITNNSKANGGNSRNYDKMTVTINPNIVPFGSIIYIDGLGFRYNQEGKFVDNTNNVYLYTEDSNILESWNEKEANIYLVHNDSDLDMLNQDAINAYGIGIFKLTAYCPCTQCCGQWGGPPEGKLGATGTYVYEGTTIAADISVIPYGSLVYIDGLGFRFVTDCGGGIKSNRIDVYHAYHNDALHFAMGDYNVWRIQ